MVATPNYTALDGTKAMEKIAATYKKKKDYNMCIAQYIQYFVILITGNWITKVFLYQYDIIWGFKPFRCPPIFSLLSLKRYCSKSILLKKRELFRGVAKNGEFFCKTNLILGLFW